jgi:trk system potassium uptake protein TrkH
MLLNIRFILKMLGAMFILETFFMLLAAAVAFFYREGDEWVLLLSAGILALAGERV